MQSLNASESEQAALLALAQLASELTGFSADAVRSSVLHRVLRAQLTAGRSVSAVYQATTRREPDLSEALLQAVSVGETYFFRHPDQFELLLDEVLPAQALSRQDYPRPWRAWSAGCATGEETYTLAACVRAAQARGIFDPGTNVSLLGTDLLERNLQAARAASYGRWSVRAAGPELVPTLTPLDDGRFLVKEEVRSLPDFQRHNLLEAPPLQYGLFDVILCRNVLVYFSPEAAAQVVSRLTSALTPDGVMLFGPMDVLQLPSGLVRYGPAELQAFRRPPVEAPIRVQVPTQAAPAPRPLPAPERARAPVREKAPSPPAPVRAVAPEPVALHLRALGLIERGDEVEAGALLDGLCRAAPDYVAGLTEHAMLLVRRGDLPGAASRMREVLRLTSMLPDETLLPGPEPLPSEFYVSSAEALLERLERSH